MLSITIRYVAESRFRGTEDGGAAFWFSAETGRISDRELFLKVGELFIWVEVLLVRFDRSVIGLLGARYVELLTIV
jgi:hypothetical protein